MLSLCTLVLLLQDPAGAKPATGKPQAVPAEAVVIKDWTDAEAQAALAEFKKATRGKKIPLRERMAAVEAVTQGKNKRLVKPLAQVVKIEKAVSVRRIAARALGSQPAKNARPAILKLLQDSSIKRQPLVQADLIGSLDRAGYGKRDWKAIKNLFEKEYGTDTVPLQKAILKLVANHEEKQAVDILLRNLGEPIPANVDDPSNPPAEYWERRWKAWQVWREDVKNALFVLTGQRFSTEREARTWIRKNGRKIGIK